MNPKDKNCPCKRKCPRHGLCDQCQQHHRKSMSNPLTTCQRLSKKDAAKKKDSTHPSNPSYPSYRD